MDRLHAGMTGAPIETVAALHTQGTTSRIVGTATAGAIAVNVALPLLELWRTAEIVPTVSRYAVVATAATMALHLRHVIIGLRNERARAVRVAVASDMRDRAEARL